MHKYIFSDFVYFCITLQVERIFEYKIVGRVVTICWVQLNV